MAGVCISSTATITKGRWLALLLSHNSGPSLTARRADRGCGHCLSPRALCRANSMGVCHWDGLTLSTNRQPQRRSSTSRNSCARRSTVIGVTIPVAAARKPAELPAALRMAVWSKSALC
jgi:hypothetical protein